MADAAAVPAWPEGVGRHVLAETSSTNAEAMRLGPRLGGPAWIMARRQTAGRGRRGRPWADPEGNFAASLAMRPAGAALDAAQVSFVAALALHDALAPVLGPAARLALKWPNDVLLNGGKVAGILLEASGAGGRIDTLVVGIGVNLLHAPPAAALEPGAVRAVSIAGETGQRLTPDEMLDRLAPAFAARLAQREAAGFAAIRAAWLARAARLGEELTARTGQATLTGRFDGIDADGALVLLTAAGRAVVPAADIHFTGT